MADNTVLNAGSGGDTIRDLNRSGVKTQIVALDLDPAGSETLMAGAMPIVGTGSAGSPEGGILTVQGSSSMTKLLVTPDSVALPNHQSTNVDQIAGNSINTGHGTAAGSIRVELPTDGTGAIATVGAVTLITDAVTVVGDAANGATAAGNPVQIGGVATNVEPTAVSTGQAVAAAYTLAGKAIVLPYANPENTLNGSVSTTDSSTHTLLAAQGSGVRSYLNSIQLTNTSGTGTYVTLTDGTSTLYLPAPAGGGCIVPLPTPFRSAPNTAVTVQAAAGVSTILVSCMGYKGV